MKYAFMFDDYGMFKQLDEFHTTSLFTFLWRTRGM